MKYCSRFGEVLTLLACVVTSHVTAAVGAAQLTVTLQADKEVYKQDEAVSVKVSFQSTGPGPLRLPAWQFPQADGNLDDSLFQVQTPDGTSMVYLGRRMKVNPEMPLTVIPATRTMTFQVDLDRFYEFPTDGDYLIAYVYNGFSSNTIRVTVQGRSRESGPIAAGGWYSQGLRCLNSRLCVQGCTRRQRDLIVKARKHALKYSRVAKQYLAKHHNTSSTTSEGTMIEQDRSRRYSTWFGNYTAERLIQVKTNFAKLVDTLSSDILTFDCSTCLRPWHFAYVVPSQTSSKVVFLCNYFWRTSMLGVDSKAGTIVHEVSHFLDVAGTGDYAYGHLMAQDLAKATPEYAVTNADSYEYFAENTPFLP